MRSQVRRIGTLSGMQFLVDFFGELAADALDLGEILDACAHDAPQAPEPGQQLPAALGPDAADALERGSRAPLRASRAVAGDREAVRLVAYLLDQVQPRMIGRERRGVLTD